MTDLPPSENEPLRFLVDENLGRLVPWLRVLGHDTERFRSWGERGGPRGDEGDAILVERATLEQRIILTRDTRIQARGARTIVVHSTRWREQVREVAARLAIPIPGPRVGTRCGECNTILERLDASTAAALLPPAALPCSQDATRCPTCLRVYWRGSHFRHMLAELEAIAHSPPPLPVDRRRHTEAAGEKEGWLRRHPLIVLPLEHVTRLVQPAFAGARAERTRLLQDGLCNTNYQVWLAGRPEPLLLRLYTHLPAACEKDVALDRLFAEGARGASVPRPRIVHADASCQHAPVPYALMEWRHGVRLSDLRTRRHPPDLAPAAQAIGHVLACIASHTFPRPGFFQHGLDLLKPSPAGPAPRSPADAEASGQMPPYLECVRMFLCGEGATRHLPERTTQDILRLAEQHAPAVAPLMDEARLVHGDFNGPNLLLCEGPRGWEVAAVLDWEFAFSGTPLFDIGNLLRHADDAFAQAFARGYTEQGGTLPEGWRQLARMLDLIPLCQMLSRPQQSEASLRELLALIQATLLAGEVPGLRPGVEGRVECGSPSPSPAGWVG